MAGAWQKIVATGIGVAAMLTLSVAHASLEEQAVKFKRPAPPPELQAKYDAYMHNIEPVYYPPVPFGWQVVVGSDNSVSYVHSDQGEGPDHVTTIKMRYTRKTANMDAQTYMRNYAYTHSCNNLIKQGTGFYTADCLDSNTYAIVIGEVDNLYIVELTGDYNNAARAIIEGYISAIITGKKVFADRNIGNMRDRDDSLTPAPEPESEPTPAPAEDKAPAEDADAENAKDAAAEEDEGFFSWLPF